MTTWDEPKRRKNIKDHGLDFVGCEAIWDNFTITREDIRQAYGEKRLVTFGILEGTVAVLVYTERRAGPTSFPYARRRNMKRATTLKSPKTDRKSVV